MAEQQGVSNTLINRALHELNKAATDTSKHLYDRNKAVYGLLRYGVKVSPARARIIHGLADRLEEPGQQ